MARLLSVGTVFGLAFLQTLWAQSGSSAFESLGQGAKVASEPKAPKVYIAGSLAETDRFQDLLLPDHQRAVTRVDFSSRFVVAVLRGAVGMNGYGITIEELKFGEQGLKIKATLKDPSPDGVGRPAFTSPYHVVSVPKAAFSGAKPKSWVLEDARGRVLAREP